MASSGISPDSGGKVASVDRYLLDSDVLIWILRGRHETIEMVKDLMTEGNRPYACSALSVMEVWAGARKGESERTDRVMGNLEVVPVDARIAKRAASLLADSKRTDPRKWIDALIAATAMENGMTLVTYNLRDYQCKGLKLHPIRQV